jgi:hypothetical protein
VDSGAQGTREGCGGVRMEEEVLMEKLRRAWSARGRGETEKCQM